jgi:hypothetical protein
VQNGWGACYALKADQNGWLVLQHGSGGSPKSWGTLADVWRAVQNDLVIVQNGLEILKNEVGKDKYNSVHSCVR